MLRERWFIRHIFKENNQATGTLVKIIFMNEKYLCLYETRL